jgi:protein-S-isoprenylcysteine O-methyltransferase Ste14
MEREFVFRIILPAVIVLFVAHRGYYVTRHSKPEKDTLKKREEGVASQFAGILSVIGFVTVIAHTANPSWIAWASLPLPVWVRWIGVGVAALGFVLLQWAQNTLGRNWSDLPRMLKEQSLITSGPYQYVRHPIYTAFILILGSSLLISSNWLVGLAWIGMTVVEVASRIGFEESLMLEFFGDEYRNYMKRTGRLFPTFIPQSSTPVNPEIKTK